MPWLGLVDDPKAVHEDGGTNPFHGSSSSGIMEGVATGDLRLLEISSPVMWTVSRVACKKDEGMGLQCRVLMDGERAIPHCRRPGSDPEPVEDMRP